MQIGVKVAPVKKFNSKLIFKRWLKSGKRHIRGHKTKHKPNLKELETTEKEFFIDLTTRQLTLKKIEILSEAYCYIPEIYCLITYCYTIDL